MGSPAEEMGRYGKVYAKTWRDQTFRGLHPDTQRLWLYLLSCPHATSAPGLMYLPLGMAAFDLRATETQVGNAMEGLERAGFVEYDYSSAVLWMPKALKYDPPASSKNVRGWLKAMPLIPDCPLKAKAVEVLWAHPMAEGSTKPSVNTSASDAKRASEKSASDAECSKQAFRIRSPQPEPEPEPVPQPEQAKEEAPPPFRPDPFPQKKPTEPKPPDKPEGSWEAHDFWQWAQWKRHAAARLERERAPHPDKLDAWWAEVRDLEDRTPRLMEGFLRYGDDPYWQAKTPPLPFHGFMRQWGKYIPQGRAHAPA